MKKNLIKGVSICILSASLFSGCASKISGGQEKELASYKAKGLYVEEKSIGGAAALGILPGGGSFYTRHYGLGIANLCLWPISILWDPVSGVWGAESINYYATKEKVEKEIECVKDKGPRRRGPCVELCCGRRGVRPRVGLSRR